MSLSIKQFLIVTTPEVHLFSPVLYLKTKKSIYPQNFPLGEWTYAFCKHQLENLDNEISPLYLPDFLNQQMELVKASTNEENWYRVPNDLNLSMINEFCTKN